MLFGKCGHKKDEYYQATHLPYRSVLLLTGNDAKQSSDNTALRALAKGQEKLIYTMSNMFKKLRNEIRELKSSTPRNSEIKIEQKTTTVTVKTPYYNPDAPVFTPQKTSYNKYAYEAPKILENPIEGKLEIKKMGGISDLKVKRINPVKKGDPKLKYESDDIFENGGAKLLDNPKKPDEIYTLIEYNTDGTKTTKFMNKIMPTIDFEMKSQGEARLELMKKERRILNMVPKFKPPNGTEFQQSYQIIKRRVMEKDFSHQSEAPTIETIKKLNEWTYLEQQFRIIYVNDIITHFKNNGSNDTAAYEYMKNFHVQSTISEWWDHLFDTLIKLVFIHVHTNYMIAKKRENNR